MFAQLFVLAKTRPLDSLRSNPTKSLLEVVEGVVVALFFSAPDENLGKNKATHRQKKTELPNSEKPTGIAEPGGKKEEEENT